MIGRLQTLFNLRRSLRVWISVTFGTLALVLMLVFGWLIDGSMRENVDPKVFSQLHQLTWVYGTFLVGVFILVGWLEAGQITRPLRQIAAAAHRISQEHSEEMIPIFPGYDEVASLSLSLNLLLTYSQR